MRTRWVLTLFLLLSPWLRAKADVQYFPERKVWVLQAGETTYAFGVNQRGELQSIYWGQRVARGADFGSPQLGEEVASFDISNTIMIAVIGASAAAEKTAAIPTRP